MDLSLILGFIIAFCAFFFGVEELRNDFGLYIQFGSFILVIGGTIASTMISSSMKEVKKLIAAFKQIVVKPKKIQPFEAVSILVNISQKAQAVSKQELAREGIGIGDGFLERALSMVAAGLDKEFIRRTLQTDIDEIQRRHMLVASKVRTMGTFAPMFGMTGTVLGVIQVLKNVTDITNIVSGMSLALLTTLYGLVLSSVVFIPLSFRLKGASSRELLTKEIIMEGTMAILDKEIPLKVEKHLTSYLEGKFKKNSAD